MQRWSRISFNLVLLLVLLGVMQPAWGQQVTAAITGTVVDPGGAPISGATVTAPTFILTSRRPVWFRTSVKGGWTAVSNPVAVVRTS